MEIYYCIFNKQFFFLSFICVIKVKEIMEQKKNNFNADLEHKYFHNTAMEVEWNF